MKKRILYLAIVCLFFCLGGNCVGRSTAGVDARDATQVVMHQVLLGNPAGRVVYRATVAVKKGEVIRSMAHSYASDTFDEAYVFFIDDAPDANWEHACRYVFVDTKTGAFKVMAAQSPPDDLGRYSRIYPER